MPFLDPGRAAASLLHSAVGFCRVGGSRESIVRSSKRLVKRKSCSPDSQTSTCLFLFLWASLPITADFSLEHPCEHQSKMATQERSWRTENQTQTSPLFSFSFYDFNIFFYQTVLDLERAFKKSSRKRTGKVLRVLKLQYIAQIHQYASVRSIWGSTLHILRRILWWRF